MLANEEFSRWLAYSALDADTRREMEEMANEYFEDVENEAE